MLSCARCPLPVPAAAAAAACLVAAAPCPAQAPAARGAPEPVAVLRPGDRFPRRVHLRVHPEAIAAIDQGLEWLLDRQGDDGRWDADAFMTPSGDEEIGAGGATHDCAVTGLAMLALAREGRPDRAEPSHRALVAGAHWLATEQRPDGLVGAKASHDFIYDHAIATLGLLAAAAAIDSGEARAAAEQGLAYLEQHRNPYAVWRYMPRDGDNDMSVTTWCTLACLAGRELGLEVPDAALAAVQGWLDQVTDGKGRTGYSRAGEPSSRAVGMVERFPPDRCETMTGAGLLCRLGLGQGADETTASASLELVLARPPAWQPEQGRVDYCYWFFAGEALRHVGGQATAAWRGELVRSVVAGQRKDGAFEGSWDPVGPWGDQGGRLYATAMAVLALQSLYPLEDS